MIRKTAYQLCISITFILFSLVSNGQISVSNISEIPKIKMGTTFFAMKDPSSPSAKEYVEAIKKNWSLSKVECIKYTDIEKNIAPNNTFVTIGGAIATFSSGTMTGSSHAEYANTRHFLEFWTTDGKFKLDPKKRKHFNPNDKILLAQIELFPDYPTLAMPSSLFTMEYDADGHLKNWSAGILGNYIQCLTTFFNKAEVRKMNKEIGNKEELKKLTAETLFVPDYILTKFNRLSGAESKKIDEKDLFEYYLNTYKIISMEELSTKILTDDKPFYYLIYVKSSTDKYVSVMNSVTGEMIYAVHDAAFNMKPSDLKDLQKAILKN